MCTTSKNNKKTTYFIKLVTFFISLFLFSNYLKSQCLGTFYKVDGENFGSGASMFHNALPIGTTTYNYRGGGLFLGCIGNMNFTSVPDSFYSIAKNPAHCLPVSCNLSFSSDWINAGDHSNGTGYMMIANARGFPDIFYNKVYSVAPNSTINFSVWAANICKLSVGCIPPKIKILFRHPTTNIVLDSINSSLLASVSDSTLNWIKISKSFLVPSGLSDIKLEIRNMQVGNAGNDVAIDDIEFSICMPSIVVSDTVVNVCKTKSFSINPTIPNNNLNDITYLWQFTSDINGVWTSLTSDTNKLFIRNNVSNIDRGFYRLLIAERGNINNPNFSAYSEPIRVSVLDTNMRYIFDTLCSNGLRVFNGQNIVSTGIYRDTLVNAQGCDSFVILNLFVKPTSTGSLNVSICSNATYFFNGQMLSATGIYRDTLKNMRGCDSFLTLNLTVKNISFKTIYDTICSNGLRVFNGQNIVSTGIYRDTLVNAQGCDSFVILNLFVKPTSTGSLNVSICSNATYFFNGQMLSATGIYRDTLKNMRGCDSFLTLNLTVKNISFKTIYDTICSNGIRVFNGQSRTTTGIYRDTLLNSQGCDSFIFLNLFVKPSNTGTLNVSICSNTTYFFNGKLLNASGSYKDTLKNAQGCDSFLTLNLTVKNISFKTIYDTICSNRVRVFNSQNITHSGIYRDTLVNVQGCDSFIFLNLFVKPSNTGTLNVSICSNATYFFNGKLLNASGSYKDTLKNTQGCDSFLTLNLTVKNISSKTIFDTICSNGFRIFNSQSITKTGIYRDTLVNVQGCDSFLFLNLFVKPTTTGTLNVSICSDATYFFNGKLLNASGSYKDTLKNAQGCDSFLTLNITVKNISFKTIFDTICSNGVRVFNNQNITHSGIYRDTLKNAQGCDSFIILNLFVKPTTTEILNVIICSNESYFFNGQLLNTSGSYFDTLKNAQGCDSFLTLNLIVRSQITTTIDTIIYKGQSFLFKGQLLDISGTYIDTFVNDYGCDSIIYNSVIVEDTFKDKYESENEDFIIPNYISPNGDNVNDFWVLPQGIYKKYPYIKSIIYNRWGNIVWRSIEKYNDEWYGQHFGEQGLVPDGVYYYLLELEENMKVTRTGFIEVMR